MNGFVSIIGAGCGGKELVTEAALTRLASCDAVVYDDLIDLGLPELAPPEAKRIYMGKRRGAHSAAQEEINAELIRLAQQGLAVVRLKGGDPFVFGRGGEEAIALQKAGIGYELVPGISSCIAIPEEAGIPVTHRGISRSFCCLTAHTKDGDEAFFRELRTLAGTEGTLVILMGLRKLRQIADCLLSAGMRRTMPAAVVSGRSTGHPYAVRGPLCEIADRAEKEHVQAPAVIVIGETAAMDLRSVTEGLPLAGVVVGVTGTDRMRGKLSLQLERLGAKVYAAERSVLKELAIPREELERLSDGTARWVVFTSAGGVRLFFRQLQEQEIDLRRLHACRFAVIGRGTGEALRARGIFPDLCPEHFTGEDLARELAAIPGKETEACLFRSSLGGGELPRILAGRYRVRDIPVYELRADQSVKAYAEQMLPQTDFLTFSSASGVRLFLEHYGAIPERPHCICIGTTTARAMEELGGRPYTLAPEISAEGIVRAVLQLRSRPACGE